MAPRSAISTMKSDKSMRTFISLRVVGPTLEPDEITKLLGVYPTHVHKNGETYSTGRTSITPTSGMWLLATDKMFLTPDLASHIRLILVLFGLDKVLFGLDKLQAAYESRSPDGIAFFRLAERLQTDASLSATMSFFWHGGPNSTAPTVPDLLLQLLALLHIHVELNFDKDEPASPRGSRAA
jgi:hypothetical protein